MGRVDAVVLATDCTRCVRTFCGLASPHRRLVLELIIGTALHTRCMLVSYVKFHEEFVPQQRDR